MNMVYPKIHLIQGYCNTYYVDDEKKALIDAGVDFKGDVDILILTHLHPDHVFYANKIRKRTDCQILIGEKDSDTSLIKDHFPKWDGKRVELFQIDEVLKHGDEISTGTYSFKVLTAPGHTKGSIILFEKEEKVLFSGDVVFADGRIGRTDLPHSEPEIMEETLKMIKSLDYKTLLPGHGRVVKEVI